MSTERVAIHGFGFVHACLTPRAATQHALPAHKLVVPLEGAVLSYAVDEHPEHVMESRAPLLVAAGVRHALRSDGPSVGIFVPTLVAHEYAVRARAMHEVLTGRVARRVEGLAAQLHEGLALAGAEEAMAAVTRDLLASTPVQRRVAALLAGLEERGPARPSLEALAASAQLSPSRLSHLFAEETGTSLRAWLSFRRAFLAVRALGAVNMVIELVHPGFFPAHHPFMQLLIDSRYLLVPKLLELVGGLLLFTRYRALGMTLLWPVIVNIALFHAFLEPRYGLNGPILLVLAALASWPERHAWSRIFCPTSL